MTRYGFFFLLCTSVVSLGCGGAAPAGPKLYKAAGTVTLDGKPLKEADMVFRSADGKHSAGAKVTDGKFSTKLAAGSVIVEISALVDSPDGKFREENPGEKVPVKVQLIPKKYNSESSLKEEIKGDNESLKYDLMSK